MVTTEFDLFRIKEDSMREDYGTNGWSETTQRVPAGFFLFAAVTHRSRDSCGTRDGSCAIKRSIYIFSRSFTSTRNPSKITRVRDQIVKRIRRRR